MLDAWYAVACIVLFTAMFSACIFAGLAFWGRVLRKDERHMVGVLAAATNAGLHATVCTWWSFALLATAADWTDFNAPNSRAHNMALCLSTGYFLADTLVYLIPFTPTEVVYIAHHAITVLFLAASLHLQRGAHAVLFGIWIGEVTNPAFHVYNILNGIRAHRPWAHRAFLYVAPAFTAFFVAVRTVAGPPVAVWWCAKVASMDAPLAHRACWIFVCLAITAVSQPFALGFVRDTRALLAAERAARAERRAEAHAAGRGALRPRAKARQPSMTIYDSAEDVFALVRKTSAKQA